MAGAGNPWHPELTGKAEAGAEPRAVGMRAAGAGRGSLAVV